MRFKTVGNKYDAAFVVVRNSEASTIPIGAPVFYTFNGTNDGLDVINSNSAAALKQQFFAGILPKALATLETGEAQVFGIVQSARLVRHQTRAASTDSFSTVAAISVGDILAFNSVTGYDGLSDSGGTGVSGTQFAMLAMAQTLSSIAGVASGTASTQTINTFSYLVKAWVRAM